MSEIRIQIFDPPLCCPTGLCGPTVDPALMEIHEVATKIQKEFGERVSLSRHIFGKDVQAYLTNELVLNLIRQEGSTILPLTLVNGDVLRKGSYPSHEELRDALQKLMED